MLFLKRATGRRVVPYAARRFLPVQTHTTSSPVLTFPSNKTGIPFFFSILLRVFSLSPQLGRCGFRVTCTRYGGVISLLVFLARRHVPCFLTTRRSVGSPFLASCEGSCNRVSYFFPKPRRQPGQRLPKLVELLLPDDDGHHRNFGTFNFLVSLLDQGFP